MKKIFKFLSELILFVIYVFITPVFIVSVVMISNIGITLSAIACGKDAIKEIVYTDKALLKYLSDLYEEHFDEDED